jgi:hypothetical protein
MRLEATMRHLLFLLALAPLAALAAAGQDDISFQRDSRLLIEVHVWGEVNKPGLYRVPDGSTVLDAISLAGGPTQFAALSKVKLTHPEGVSPRRQKIDLDKYSDGRNGGDLPVLKPGDMITVPRNARFFWKDAVQILADIAIIVNVYYLLSHDR